MDERVNVFRMLLKPGTKGLLWRLLEMALFSGNAGVCVEHIYK